jgi:hypothetical protein
VWSLSAAPSWRLTALQTALNRLQPSKCSTDSYLAEKRITVPEPSFFLSCQINSHDQFPSSQRPLSLQSQDGHKQYQDIVLIVRKYLQKENSLYQDISGPCYAETYKRGNLLGINSPNGISLEISELQRIFFEKRWLPVLLDTLLLLQHEVTTSSATSGSLFLSQLRKDSSNNGFHKS